MKRSKSRKKVIKLNGHAAHANAAPARHDTQVVDTMLKSYSPEAHFYLGKWLLFCTFAVWVMVMIGGVTRLAGAGLSIVTWEPLMGIFPPLSKASWQDVFQRYQASPEYQKITFGLSLQEFKTLYWIEYFHRLWGRLMGVFLLIPTVYSLFYARKFLKPLLLIWVCAFLQGGLGWYMVKSGLIDIPWVSPYRLTAHLGMALVIFGLLLWTTFQAFWPKESFKKPSRVWYGILGLLSLTILMGGFTAGLKGGYVYNTFPKMGEHWFPEDLWAFTPTWRNFFENPTTAQWSHRLLAISSLSVVTVMIFQRPLFPWLKIALLSTISLQILLGIMTLLLQVPLFLAVLHQGNAFLLVAFVLYGLYQSAYEQLKSFTRS